jgi:hypothetical protein
MSLQLVVLAVVVCYSISGFLFGTKPLNPGNGVETLDYVPGFTGFEQRL